MGQEYLETQGKGAQGHQGQDSAPEVKDISVLDAYMGLPPREKTERQLYPQWQIIQRSWGFLCPIPEMPK